MADHPKVVEEKIDMIGLLRIAVEKLKLHETKEKKSSILEDKTLIGYYNLIEKLILHQIKDHFDDVMNILDETSFLGEIFDEGLFFNRYRTTWDSGNKCITKESRIAAF